jgi:hypothetical protein
MDPTNAEKSGDALPIVDATDALAEQNEFLAPKPPSWMPITFKGKRYAVVRPKGSVLERITAKTQQQVQKEAAKGGKTQSEFIYSARYREAWAVVASLHVLTPDGKGYGNPIFHGQPETKVQTLVDQPYENDGLLNVVGSAIVKWLNGKPLMLEVEEAKND